MHCKRWNGGQPGLVPRVKKGNKATLDSVTTVRAMDILRGNAKGQSRLVVKEVVPIRLRAMMSWRNSMLSANDWKGWKALRRIRRSNATNPKALPVRRKEVAPNTQRKISLARRLVLDPNHEDRTTRPGAILREGQKTSQLE
jgi:hypothetical protein